MTAPRYIRFLTPMIIAALLCTACSYKAGEKNKDIKEKTGLTSPAPGKMSTPAIKPTALSSDLNDLTNLSVSHPLMIAFKGKPVLEASAGLSMVIIRDLIGKSEEIILENIEPLHETFYQANKKIVENHDFDSYDVRLSFEGTKDILYSFKDNTFHFEGEKSLHRVYGARATLWDRLIVDENQKTVDIGGVSEIIMNDLKEDVDGDGTIESIQLVSGVDLQLKIDDQMFMIEPEVSWSVRPHSVVSPPKLQIAKVKKGKYKNLIVSMVWATNGIGSTVDMHIYKYVKKNANGKPELKEAQLTEPKIYADFINKSLVRVKIPEASLMQNVKIDTKYYEEYLKEDKSMQLKDLFSEKEGLYVSTTTGFGLADYDGDGYPEILTDSLLRVGYRNLGFGRLYSVYDLGEDKLLPKKCIVIGSSELSAKGTIMELMTDLASLNSLKISKIKNSILSNYPPGEIDRALNEMIKDKQLVKDGEEYRINLLRN
ncbi:MAG: hypothetical protein N2645_01195 [Clostridia bacterium]|nr:hypothetical protein [Clostridia bacterium]